MKLIGIKSQTFKRFKIGLVVLSLTALPFQAAGDHIHFRQAHPSGYNALVVQKTPLIEVGQKLSDEQITYLRKAGRDIKALRAWLKPYLQEKSWPLATKIECGTSALCVFLTRDLPTLHKNMRLILALSTNSNLLPHGKRWELEHVGNPQLFLPSFSPLVGLRESLTPAEWKEAQLMLQYFWDGKEVNDNSIEAQINAFASGNESPRVPGVIDEFLLKIEEELEKRTGPGAAQTDRRTLQKLELLTQLRDQLKATRKLPFPEVRIAQALAINNSRWQNYLRGRFANEQRRLQVTMWMMVDQVRPLAYLTKAELSAAAIDEALNQSAYDNMVQLGHITNLREKLDKDDEREGALKEIFEYVQFLGPVAEKHSELLPAMELIADHFSLHESLSGGVFLALGLAPLLLLFPPVAAIAGVGGLALKSGLMIAGISGGVIATVQTANDETRINRQYRGQWGATDFARINPYAISGQELQRAQVYATLTPSLMALSVGLPLLKFGKLKALFGK